MSNRVLIQPCKFEDVRTGEIHYGARIADSYGKSYDNTWKSIPDDDIKVIEKMMEDQDEVIVGIFDFVFEQGQGIFVGDKYYEWDQIKHLWGLEEDNNEHIEILCHDISYYLNDGAKIEIGDCEYEHIVYMINQGYCGGELSKTDTHDEKETVRGYWKIEK